MITCRLYGQLGNQLFQLSAVLAMARRLNVPFSIPQEITCPPGLDTDPIYFRHFPKVPITTEHSRITVFKEHPSQCYTPITPGPQPDGILYLDGYFQSEKYFADQRAAILRAFKPIFTLESNI